MLDVDNINGGLKVTEYLIGLGLAKSPCSLDHLNGNQPAIGWKDIGKPYGPLEYQLTLT
jgi:hypothetical protein